LLAIQTQVENIQPESRPSSGSGGKGSESTSSEKKDRPNSGPNPSPQVPAALPWADGTIPLAMPMVHSPIPTSEKAAGPGIQDIKSLTPFPTPSSPAKSPPDLTQNDPPPEGISITPAMTAETSASAPSSKEFAVAGKNQPVLAVHEGPQKTAITPMQPASPSPSAATLPPSLLLAAAPPPSIASQPQQGIAIDAPVGQRDWGNQLSQKVTWLSTQQGHTAELQLNPPDLGPLHVTLKVSQGEATALFVSPHAQVRDAVQQALPQLREMMANSGIALGNATVSDQPPRNPQDSPAFWPYPGGKAGNGDTEGARNMAPEPAGTSGQRRSGLVDTFA
jgi:flagellar hook-length control protein FliK